MGAKFVLFWGVTLLEPMGNVETREIQYARSFCLWEKYSIGFFREEYVVRSEFARRSEQ